MKFFTTRELSTALKFKRNTVQKLVQKGKIKAEKSVDGLLLIPQSEFVRLKEEKAKIKSGKYLSSDCLHKKGIRRSILFDGSVEVEILCNQTYTTWDEVKRWLKSNPSHTNLKFDRHRKTLTVLNRKGIHCQPATLICEICKKYFLKSHTQCEILFKNFHWIFPVDGASELLQMQIFYKNKLMVIATGEDSKNLLLDLVEAFHRNFHPID